MRAWLNTTTGTLYPTSSATGQPLRRIDAKRGDSLTLEIMATLPTGATGIFAAKPRGSYTGSCVVLAPAWSAPATEGAGYTFEISLNTTELDALFGTTTAEVVLMAEITWDAEGVTRSTQTFDIAVAADVWKGNEAAPTPATAPLAFRLSSPDGSLWEISITDDGQLERTKIA